MMPPFPEDSAVCRLAEDLGLQLSRYAAVEVTDLAAIKAAGLTCAKPDYSRIRAVLQSGGTVAGAELKGVEYILRRQP